MSTTKKHAGRKSKLTPKVQKRICNAIRGGNYAQVAAECAGVSERTFYNWVERGQKAKTGPYLQFLQAVRRAEAEAEFEAVKVVYDAKQTSWQPGLAWLERKFPTRWGRSEKREHSGGVRIVFEPTDDWPPTGQSAIEGPPPAPGADAGSAGGA